MQQTGGQLLINCLEAQGVECVFCVPGESYLAVLDALHDSTIATVVARQEGGAAMMAEADGKLTGRPGIAFVTRGPGATNAAAGVHVAKQDSTPLILFVGQIARGMTGRDAFQEVDFRQTFRDLAKWVEQIDDAARIPEIVSHAYHVAMNGRPGPVVLALPEDMLREQVNGEAAPRVDAVPTAPTAAQVERLRRLVTRGGNPFVVLGGSRWDADSVRKMEAWARTWRLPVAVSFRRQQLFDHYHPNYAGDLGLGASPALIAAIKAANPLILLGAKLSENPSQDFSLLGIPKPGRPLVHVLAGAEELGRIYQPDLAINATPGAFLDAMLAGEPPAADGADVADANLAWREWSLALPTTPGRLQMGEVMAHLREALPADTIITNGAGNYATWVHRFWRFGGFGTQLAPTSGSMGYGLPAAVAAALRHPEREVVCFAGDGCFQMTGQELATAVQTGASMTILVVDNSSYGTIRMHQERHYPGRVSGTALHNPDFAALAEAYGALGATVKDASEFPVALAAARAHPGPALIHLITDVEAITPTTTLTALRQGR